MIIRKMSYYKNKQIPHFVRNDDSSFGDIGGSSGGEAAATPRPSRLKLLSFRRSEATEKTYRSLCG